MHTRTAKSFLIIITALIVAAVIYFSRAHSNPTTITSEQLSEGISPVESLPDVPSKDSDSDGLADWEELVWKTNPNNPDTDDDKTLDGEEVAKNRNPNVPGPEDEISPPNTEATITETDKFAKDFLLEYIKLKQSPLTSTTLNQTIESVAQRGIIDFPTKSYSSADFRTTNDSAAALKEYGNILGNLILSNIPLDKNEITLLLSNFKEGGIDAAEALTVAQGYSQAAEQMLRITVPASVAPLHAGLTSAFAGRAATVEAIASIEKDPIVSISALKKYQDIMTEMQGIFSTFAVLYRNAGVQFTVTEPGYIVTHLVGI